jgi:hypothetical protein
VFVIELLSLLFLLLLFLVNVADQQPDSKAVAPILVVVERLRRLRRVLPGLELDQRVHRVGRRGDQVQARGFRGARLGLHPGMPDANHGHVARG